MSNGYLISNSGSITVVTNGKTYNVTTDHTNYAKIVSALKVNNFDAIPNLANVGNAITTASSGKVIVENGQVKFDGKVIHNSVTKRIIMLITTGLPFEPMVRFLENLMDNPSFRAVNELYDFLEVCNLPITEDGFFLAYKRVNDEYKDMHTNSIDNHIGSNPKMIRNLVDEDKSRVCSSGLHFCSLSYLSQFGAGSGHIMIVKINPKDVVAIPADYNNTKGRCCEYVVVDEHKIDETKGIPDRFTEPLYSSDGSDFKLEDDDTYDTDGDSDADDTEVVDTLLGVKPSGEKFWNKRDSSGKFTKRS
jgi:hypothetical protein